LKSRTLPESQISDPQLAFVESSAEKTSQLRVKQSLILVNARQPRHTAAAQRRPLHMLFTDRYTAKTEPISDIKQPIPIPRFDVGIPFIEKYRILTITKYRNFTLFGPCTSRELMQSIFHYPFPVLYSIF